MVEAYGFKRGLVGLFVSVDISLFDCYLFFGTLDAVVWLEGGFCLCLVVMVMGSSYDGFK